MCARRACTGHCQGEADSVTIPLEGVFIKTLRAAKDELSKNRIGQPDQIQLPFGRVAGPSRPEVGPKFLARMGVSPSKNVPLSQSLCNATPYLSHCITKWVLAGVVTTAVANRSVVWTLR